MITEVETTVVATMVVQVNALLEIDLVLEVTNPGDEIHQMVHRIEAKALKIETNKARISKEAVQVLTAHRTGTKAHKTGMEVRTRKEAAQARTVHRTETNKVQTNREAKVLDNNHAHQDQRHHSHILTILKTKTAAGRSNLCLTSRTIS